jgi:hypothetical protein
MMFSVAPASTVAAVPVVIVTPDHGCASGDLAA